jgi:hypothetical protein
MPDPAAKARPAPSARHNDGTNANAEAVRSGIEGARTDSKASVVALHIGSRSG